MWRPVAKYTLIKQLKKLIIQINDSPQVPYAPPGEGVLLVCTLRVQRLAMPRGRLCLLFVCVACMQLFA